MATVPHQHRIVISTSMEAPPGFEIEQILGPCWGITVRSRSVVGTTCAGCQSFFGGEITAMTELATDARNQAIDRLEHNALAMGAHAILAMSFDSGELMQNMTEIVAYGTAVKLRQS